ncbi:MAG: hypothetical protein FWF92_01330 [Oscillospiraceae bacterium]|nr:hypothetical protein [Oscillospiraceae bacterium]
MLKYKKIIFLLVLIGIILFSLGSCAKDSAVNSNDGDNNNPDIANNADNGDDNNSSDTDTTNTDATKTDKWAREPINLPETDFGGREFRVITGNVTDENRMYDKFSTEEQSGEPINDALYTRRLHVEEKFNITMITTPSASAPADVAKKSILAGDDSYDLIMDIINNVKNLGSQHLLADLFTVPYIKDDLDKPWWDQAMIRDLAINGKLYFQAGDIVLRDKLRLSCLYFNKDMCKSIGIDYPYQYVYDGTWTIDKLMEITKGVNKDLNGDGIMDQYDQWGFMSQYEFALHLFEASGETTVSLNSDGVPEITMNTPRALDVIQKALTFCADPEAMFMADTIKGAADIWIQASAYYQEDRFLIRASLFEPIARDLRAMPTDFGVVPTPKYNEQQENYYTYAEFNGHSIGIPMNADLEFAGLITEALAYESGTTLMPAFYDLCLTSKVLRDNESEGMLDIIFNNKVYDIGYIYGIGSLPTILNNLSSSKKTDFVSQFEKSQGSIEKALEKFIDNYDKE